MDVMRLSQEGETAAQPVWQNADRQEAFSLESASDASSSVVSDSMDRDILEKDVRFQVENSLEDGDEGIGFINGSRKVSQLVGCGRGGLDGVPFHFSPGHESVDPGRSL